MAAIDVAVADAIINATLGLSSDTTNLVSTVPLRIRFMASNGNEFAPGDEITPSNSQGGYLGGPSAPVIDFTPSSNGASSNVSDVSVPGMPDCVIVGVEIWDSGGESGEPQPVLNPDGTQAVDDQGQPLFTTPTGTGTRRWFGSLASPKTINEGDTFTIAAGSLTVAMA